VIGVYDLDSVKYAVASVGEKRSIVVTHKTTGNTKEFDTRTQFWGRDRKHSGGWLADINKSRTSPFLPEEFDIVDVQTPEAIENVLHSAKLTVERNVEASKAESVQYFIGKGDSFRVERSTLLGYKQQRDKTLKPLYLDEVSDYLTRKFKAEVVTHYEVDDRVVMETYKQPNKFVIALDKDTYSCAVKFFNVNRPQDGIVNCDCFGGLYLNDKNEVKGKGRMHLYYQICSLDDSDNYKAHCFSDVYWGQKSAYDALKDSKNDKEALIAMKNIFQKLYPEPKEVVGWRGNTILIDWQYVMNEMWDMARMHRFENDFVIGTEVLKGLKIL
jgi:hypothetical protein